MGVALAMALVANYSLNREPAPEPEPVAVAPAPSLSIGGALREAVRGAAGSDCEVTLNALALGSLDDWDAALLRRARGSLQGCVAAGQLEYIGTLAAVTAELQRREP